MFIKEIFMQSYNIETNHVADLWETRVLGIEGMTCDNCVKSLTKALKLRHGRRAMRRFAH